MIKSEQSVKSIESAKIQPIIRERRLTWAHAKMAVLKIDISSYWMLAMDRSHTRSLRQPTWPLRPGTQHKDPVQYLASGQWALSLRVWAFHLNLLRHLLVQLYFQMLQRHRRWELVVN